MDHSNISTSFILAEAGRNLILPSYFSNISYNPSYSDDVNRKQVICNVIHHIMDVNNISNEDLHKNKWDIIEIHQTNRHNLKAIYKTLIETISKAGVIGNDFSPIHKRNLEKFEALIENMDRCDIFVLKPIIAFIKNCDRAFVKMTNSKFNEQYEKLSSIVENFIDYPGLAYVLGADGYNDISSLTQNLKYKTNIPDISIKTIEQLVTFSNQTTFSFVDRIRLLHSYATIKSREEKSASCHPIIQVNSVLHSIAVSKLTNGSLVYNSKSSLGIQELMDLWYDKMILPNRNNQFMKVHKEMVAFYHSLNTSEFTQGNIDSSTEFSSWFNSRVVDVLKKFHGKLVQKKSKKQAIGDTSEVKTKLVYEMDRDQENVAKRTKINIDSGDVSDNNHSDSE
jgi:hypothetical protein